MILMLETELGVFVIKLHAPIVKGLPNSMGNQVYTSQGSLDKHLNILLHLNFYFFNLKFNL